MCRRLCRISDNAVCYFQQDPEKQFIICRQPPAELLETNVYGRATAQDCEMAKGYSSNRSVRTLHADFQGFDEFPGHDKRRAREYRGPVRPAHLRAQRIQPTSQPPRIPLNPSTPHGRSKPPPNENPHAEKLLARIMPKKCSCATVCMEKDCAYVGRLHFHNAGWTQV
jgi:hypothetical protein